MKKLWNEMKEKRFDERIKKLEKQALHYIQENENLERHIADLQGSNKVAIMETTKKNDDEVKETKKGTKSMEKHINKKTSQKQNKSYTDSEHDSKFKTNESDESGINSITLKRKRPRKRSTRRCHLCRKRGHTKGECPFGPVVPEWP